MNDIFLLVGKIITLIMYFLYWPLIFRLTDTILEKGKREKWLRIPLALFNTTVLLVVSSVKGGSTYSYALLFVLLMLSLYLLYKDSIAKILFCASSCIIHVMALRAFVTGIIGVVLDRSVYEVANHPTLFILSIGAGTVITNIAIVLVLKLVPAEKIRIINQHKEQQWFLIAWMSVFNVYLLFNSEVFWEETYHPNIVGNEIIISAAILAGLYIVVFFAFKTISLLGYKEKSAELQREIYQEQQFKSSAIKDAIMIYEINITQDRMLRGFEENEAELGEMVHCYSDMLAFMMHRFVCSEDIERFAQYGSRANLTREFEEGRSETTIEYRRLMETGKYIWVRAVTNLTQNAESGDLIAFVFVKNIDDEKEHQLKLQYKAEHDPLTGLYNKEMTGKLINEALTFYPSQTGSALFMIDADNFKEVNDQLGHVYGDAVLCELAEKLQRVFSADDIVGRVGGDEYIVFMKEAASSAAVEEKAAEICRAFYTVFTGEDEKSFVVSGSVGISIAPKDGDSFAELYHCADIALYDAKSSGKNTYFVYQGSNFGGYHSDRNEIVQTGTSISKSFRQNRVEYIFKILYQADSPVTAIRSALELVASHFSFERGYIIEMSRDGKTASNTFEWCAEGTTSQMELLQNIPINTVIPSYSRFCEEGVFVMRSLEDSPLAYRQFLEPLGINLMMQFGIFDNGKLLGFIGFDNCEDSFVPSDMDIDEMKTICNILATFFVKNRIAEESAESLSAMSEVMNHFGHCIYVIDPESFEVLFMNEKMHRLMGVADAFEPCYSHFRGNAAPCEDCPISVLADSPSQRMTRELYSQKLNIWLDATFSYLRWTNGRTACLISGVDITEQRTRPGAVNHRSCTCSDARDSELA